VGFTGGDGAECRVPLAEAAWLPLEEALPARRIVSRRGQRHLPGQWWSSTCGCHVGFESWLERDHLMLMDFDPGVAAIASQPFWLSWTDAGGKRRRHAPDYFARRVDGTGVVVDCRPEEMRGEPRDREAFEAARRACGEAGWEYRLAGRCDPVLAANVRWLAGYRHPRYRVAGVAARLLGAAAWPAPLMGLARSAGDPLAVLPVLFHLLWRHELETGLRVPLHPAAEVRAAGAGR
jgi:TnsA-like endonuclease N terminal